MNPPFLEMSCRNDSSRHDGGGKRSNDQTIIESNLKENVRDVKVCTDFAILEVKVPIIFSGT